MAERDKIEYVRYYAPGSAAHKVEPEPQRPAKPRTAPKPKAEKIAVPFDPVAVFGTTVAIVMILCVFWGFAQVNHLNDQIAGMESAISGLKSEQYTLQKEFSASIDLEDIRTTALAMGLVPMEEVRHITITVPQPEPVEELPWWQELWLEFKAMFE